FTPRNGTVTVALDSTDNSKIRLTVSDTGKGIPIEERERLFDPFTQSDNGDNGVETSVNLSLVNQLVQSLNGTITVDSELGRGTMFTIELPIQAVNRASVGTFDIANKRIINADVNKQKPLVFIVENDEDVAYFVANQLKEDYELRFAHDGQEALNNASELVPALIITSIKMPVMDGKELMRRLRHNPTLSHTAIIAMTSISTESERLSCLEAGADAVIVKPFISDELKLHTRNLIRQTATGWTMERMGKVDLTILRLAVYEMKMDDTIPVSVAINEAVELAKKFGQDESPSFVNGVLAKFTK
ncbi:MAG: transcription antitermination factor NusB, partial [Lachnospiraceae bacterium]|nr:transcription antitermination factor NusB [Lachnospiraceae bacterium]